LRQRIQPAPRIDPVFPQVDFLQDLLSCGVVTPEVRLMSLDLQLFDFSFFLVEVKDTPSERRVSLFVPQAFPSIPQT
jgi:hypothetical protein